MLYFYNIKEPKIGGLDQCLLWIGGGGHAIYRDDIIGEIKNITEFFI